MFKSNPTKPSDMLRRVNDLAREYGVLTLPDQLALDRESTGDIFIAAINDSTFLQVLTSLARAASVDIEQVDDDTFAFVEAEQNPISYEDPHRFAFAFSSGYIVVTRSTNAFSSSTDCTSDDAGILDLIVLSCAMKVSQRDRYMLVRYNDKAMMANRAFASGSYTESSSGRPTSDMWNMFDGILLEMRSVVLELETCETASLPFYKFHNLGECVGYSMENVLQAIDDAERVEITDKMDGSFVQMKWMGADCDLFDEHRLTSFSGSLNPETNSTLAFANRWIRQLEESGIRYTDMCADNEDMTFIFEFIRPDLDSHIVRYDESRWGIYLLSARNVKTGETMFYSELEEIARRYNVPMTKQFEDYQLSDVIDVCHNESVSRQEGFVVNIDGWYVKVKLDEFCQISKLVHGSNNFNAVIANVARGTFDDLIAKIPIEFHEPLLELAHELMSFDEDMHSYINMVASRAPRGDMKQTAMYIFGDEPVPFAPLCMDAIRNGSIDGLCYLHKTPRKDNSGCWKQHEFEERKIQLADAISHMQER